MLFELGLALLMVLCASVIISYACNSFDEASSYLGRNMKPGIRGATINAIGSSLPELFTAFFLLFSFQDQGGFSAGIATTAGSAVFNAVVIPMLCIFVVCYRGIGEGIARRKIPSITLCKKSILRDGVFLLIAEVILIYFLGGTSMAWWMGGALMLVYVAYFCFLMRGFGSGDAEGEQDDCQDDKNDSLSGMFTDKARKTKIRALLTFDFNELFFAGRAYSAGSAWVVLVLSIVVISIACYALAEAVILSAESLGIAPYFTAIILAAAASSVPDAILSVKDAVRGDYDDALSNAIGSNIFDITVSLGLPLFAYGLIYGDVLLDVSSGGDEQIQVLRFVLIAVTIAVLASLLLSKSIGLKTAWFFGALYTAWIGYIVYTAGLQANWF